MEDAAKDPRVYFAAERTFLAWIRTGLALMGFGFVVARFGLFLQEIQVARGGAPTHSHHLSLWFGVVLVLIGVLVSLLASVTHLRLIRRLRSGDTDVAKPSVLALAVAIGLACVGVAIAIYLVVGAR